MEKTVKPRNPFARHVRLKRSGAHTKSKKFYRRLSKKELKAELQ